MGTYEKTIKNYIIENNQQLFYAVLIAGVFSGTMASLRIRDYLSKQKENSIEKNIEYKPRKTIDGYLL